MKFFSEKPESIRRLVLLLYVLVGPPFLLVMHVLAKADPLHDVLVVSVFVLVASGALWVFLRRHPGTWDWIYPVSLAPTICCALAMMGCHEQGMAFLVVMIAPTIWASAIFPARVAVVGWGTAVSGCLVATVHTSGSLWVASANALVFGVICGLVAWVVHMKASHLRALIVKHEQAEELHRVSEESYRNQFTHNSSIMLLIDTQTGAILDANERAQDFYGYSHEAFVSLSLRQINAMSPDAIRAVMDSVPAESGQRFETTHRLSDGTTRSVEVSSSRIQYAGKIAFHAIVTDITALKKTTDRLVSNEQNFRTFFNTVEDLIFVADPSGVIFFTNNAVVSKLGYSARELEGMHVLDVHPQAKRGEAEAIFAEMFAGQRSTCPLPLCRKNGTWLAVETRVWFGKWDGKDCIFGISKDISKEQDSQRKFNQIFQINPALMAISTIPDRLFTDANQAFLDALGYQREEILGKSAQELGLFRQPEKQKEIGDQLLATGRIRNVELEVRAKDGRILHGLFSGEIIESSGHQLFLTVMVDITARKQAEKMLENTIVALNESTATACSLAAQAQLSSQAKSEFLATMSHEIRTPMNGVIGMTHLLLATDLTPEQSRFAQTIRQSGESLLEIINDILDYSRIESGKFHLEILDFDLRVLMESFADSLALRASEKKLAWNCIVDESVPVSLRGDPGRLRQILTNLAGNAFKFTSEGEVSVGVAVCEDSDDAVLLGFSVKDTGIGIPADKIGILFEKFTQVDSSTSRKFGGTGLGLAISKQMVAMMGGQIGVTSLEGRGSTFWFTARFAKQTASTFEVAAPVDELCGRRVLIVDGNATSRMKMSGFASLFGMRVVAVGSRSDAVAKLRESKSGQETFDVALIDDGLEGMGAEAIRGWVRSESGFGSVAVAVVVPLDKSIEAKEMVGSGIDGVLPKPVHRSEMMELLRKLSSGAGNQEVSPRPDAGSVAETGLVAADGSKLRILVVEDNLINIMVAKGMLTRMGYETEAVSGGAEAIEVLAGKSFDLVFLDCQMPEMDGYEVARRIRSGNSSVLDPQIPIVAMTANVMPGDREKCLSAGMDDYIAKPIDPMDVSTKIKRWTGTRNL